MVGRHGDAGDRLRMRVEVRDKGCLQTTCAAIPRHEAVARSVPPTNGAFVYPGPEVVLQVAVIVEVQVLEEVADSRLLAVCDVL